LIKISNNLKRKYNQKIWSNRSYSNIEKDLFIGFYMIRKLMDSNKIINSLNLTKICVKKYPFTGKYNNDFKYKSLYDLYNLYESEDIKLSLRDLCNQFIHSYFFSMFIPFKKSLLGFFYVQTKKRTSTYIILDLYMLSNYFNLLVVITNIG